MKLIGKINNGFGVNLSIIDLLQSPTIGELAVRIESEGPVCLEAGGSTAAEFESGVVEL